MALIYTTQAITGDFESRFALLVRARREQRDHQTISDYRLQVERLRGRINVMADHRDCTGVIKFDGWPEVSTFLLTKFALLNRIFNLAVQSEYLSFLQ